jgi:3-deoxy-7-phosphoheptulonate synthase
VSPLPAIQQTHDLHIRETISLVSPKELKTRYPVSDAVARTVFESRNTFNDIIAGKDDRLAVVVGPCSIHNVDSAKEYAERLRDLAEDVKDRLFVVMRVYFEKPRTTVGWKGLINDPHLNDTFDISTGLKLARQLLLEIAELGLPAGTELLEPVTPQYIADLLTWTAIGARTTESPTHRQMASGLSMPVGYKNGTEGDLQVAIDAILAAKAQQSFLGIDQDGNTCILNTAGNEWGSLILRGGRTGSNFHAEAVKDAVERLDAAGVLSRLIVDCSHANSAKDYSKQCVAWNDVIDQRASGSKSIVGLMVESNLRPGNQKPAKPTELEYGVSITDGCIGWDETEQLIRDAHRKLS